SADDGDSRSAGGGVRGGGGMGAVARNAAPICRYYARACDADNHAVREAGCQGIAELARKVGGHPVYAGYLSPHVGALLQALIMCFHDESWPVRDEACLACGTFCLAYPEECEPELGTLFERWTEQLTDQIWSVRGGRGRGARGRRGGVRARPVREGPVRSPEGRAGREGPAGHVPRGLREPPERHRRAHEPAAVQLRQPRPEAAEGRRGADRLLELRREQAQGAVGGDGRVRLPAKGALRAVPRPGLDRARGRRRDGRHAAAADDGARRRLPAVSLSPERRPEDDALAPAPADRGGARQAPVQGAVPRPVRGPPGQEPRREERDVAAFGPRGGAVRRGPGVADRPGGVPGQARGGGDGRGFRLRQGHGGEAEGEGSGRRGWQVPRRSRGDVPFPLCPPDDRLGS
ncbi:hypothetical protein THAOC_35909, partial [Thalassiosira oceanica]